MFFIYLKSSLKSSTILKSWAMPRTTGKCMKGNQTESLTRVSTSFYSLLMIAKPVPHTSPHSSIYTRRYSKFMDPFHFVKILSLSPHNFKICLLNQKNPHNVGIFFSTRYMISQFQFHFDLGSNLNMGSLDSQADRRATLARMSPMSPWG